MDVQKILEDVKQFLVKEGDRVYQNWHTLSVTDLKDGGADVTTNFDKEIEKGFHDYIMPKYPDFGFQGEEFPELEKDGEYKWMIDPIDGTKFFAAGVPLWSTTLALVKKGNYVADLGVIYNPISKQLYEATIGGGALLNGNKISISPETDIKKLQVVFDLSSTAIGEFDFTEDMHAELNDLERNFYRARMIGNGALALAWTAQGFFGAFVDPLRPEAKLVDISAGLLIAQEAGAKVFVDDHKYPNEVNATHTVVASPAVLDKIVAILHK